MLGIMPSLPVWAQDERTDDVCTVQQHEVEGRDPAANVPKPELCGQRTSRPMTMTVVDTETPE